jgi:hypothetical protein
LINMKFNSIIIFVVLAVLCLGTMGLKLKLKAKLQAKAKLQV